MDILGTGTFGKIGSAAEIEDLKVENAYLRNDLREIKE
jgi:hypothetical protein